MTVRLCVVAALLASSIGCDGPTSADRSCSAHLKLRGAADRAGRESAEAEIQEAIEGAFANHAKFQELAGNELEKLQWFDCPECDRLVDRWLLIQVWHRQRGLPRP